MKTRSLFTTALMAVLFAFVPVTSHAAVIGSFNPNATITAIGGSGNPDTGWAAASGGGSTVGLRAHPRFDVYAGSTSSPTFTFDTGTQVSIDFTFAATGTDPEENELTDFTFALYWDSDLGAGTNWMLISPDVTKLPTDPFPGGPGFGHDNDYGTYGVTANGAGNNGPAFLPSASLGANSQVSTWMGATSFSTEAQSGFALQGTKKSNGQLVSRTEIAVNSVNPVPEPTSSMLFGISAFLGLMTRRRKR